MRRQVSPQSVHELLSYYLTRFRGPGRSSYNFALGGPRDVQESERVNMGKEEHINSYFEELEVARRKCRIKQEGVHNIDEHDLLKLLESMEPTLRLPKSSTRYTRTLYIVSTYSHVTHGIWMNMGQVLASVRTLMSLHLLRRHAHTLNHQNLANECQLLRQCQPFVDLQGLLLSSKDSPTKRLILHKIHLNGYMQPQRMDGQQTRRV